MFWDLPFCSWYLIFWKSTEASTVKQISCGRSVGPGGPWCFSVCLGAAAMEPCDTRSGWVLAGGGGEAHAPLPGHLAIVMCHRRWCNRRAGGPPPGLVHSRIPPRRRNSLEVGRQNPKPIPNRCVSPHAFHQVAKRPPATRLGGMSGRPKSRGRTRIFRAPSEDASSSSSGSAVLPQQENPDASGYVTAGWPP